MTKGGHHFFNSHGYCLFIPLLTGSKTPHLKILSIQKKIGGESTARKGPFAESQTKNATFVAKSV
ncbi:hypothetical protein F4V44_10085 [Niallia endozanthoxylica]|uniref:Uncharacterized protein n=1 Tax=Niallia endozanthoxylica TaxID=2036016 RepID=A0A5J5HV61_9BACI|nr:hypothetical protein F4V44_10085 [Niallia endozanthoxylica]